MPLQSRKSSAQGSFATLQSKFHLHFQSLPSGHHQLQPQPRPRGPDQSTHILLKDILLGITSHGPEVSHMASLCCKGSWEMSTILAVTVQLKHCHCGRRRKRALGASGNLASPPGAAHARQLRSGVENNSPVSPEVLSATQICFFYLVGCYCFP